VKPAKLSGEDAVVARLTRLLGGSGKNVITGIGDDCAVVRGPAGGRLLLLKTDCVVEGRHFLESHPAGAIGWKAACRAVSDMAACGGEPVSALVTCVIRPEQSGSWLDALYRGIAKAGREFGFNVVGGELARTDGPAVISVSMTGEVEPEMYVGRGGGRPGDLLYVTGVLGGSLKAGWHLRFRPRLPEARWLAGKFRLRALMDLSDGLAADLPRLARASGAGFVLDQSSIPRRRGATLKQALGDGEDFELLFALAPSDAAALQKAWSRRWPALRLTCIGRLELPSVHVGLDRVRGFDHFAP
jgi:thiamine-monophosphate kinase